MVVNSFIGPHFEVSFLGAGPISRSELYAALALDQERFSGEGSLRGAEQKVADLYRRYGDSWRVRKGESLLCKSGRVRRSNPSKPFSTKDLKPTVARRARAVCLRTGVKRGPLLEACTLDVAVIGPKAADAFVGQAAPRAIAVPK